MDAFRYEQACPLARATEILGHRWVLVILRELFAGPQRFSDLRRRLPGLSSSVLADRLAFLEEQGIVARRDIEPPVSSTVYELTPNGAALEPVLIALTRWGVRFLVPPVPGDHVEPDWLKLAVKAFARTEPTPACRLELRPVHGDRRAVLRVAGGPDGTHAIDDALPVDASIEAPVAVVMGLMSGQIPLEAVVANDEIQIEGDTEKLARLSELFKMEVDNPNPKGTSP